MNRIGKLIAALALGAVCVGAIAPRANAQDDPRDKKITLSLNDADVRDALKLLFKNVGVQYSIAPDVQGTVVVDIKEVPFETALRNILEQVKATYRVVGGIYEIIMREVITNPGTPSGDNNPSATATKPIRRFKIIHADPYEILMLLAGQSPPYPEISAVMNGGSNGNNNGGYGNGNGGNGGYGNSGYGGGSGGFGGGGYGGGGFGGGGSFGGGGFGGGGYGGGGGGFGGGGGGGFGGRL